VYQQQQRQQYSFNAQFSDNLRDNPLLESHQTILDFATARDRSGALRRAKSLPPPTNKHSASLQAGRPSCRPTNSIESLKVLVNTQRE